MGRLGSLWERITSTLWFVPAAMVAASVALFVVTLQWDQSLRGDFSGMPLLFSGGPTAARSLLSAIAGSIITVAATTFSLTIVALQLASSQYSPRVLRNFTSDKGVQVVLGTFLATFLYALLVLRVVRAPVDGAPTFVPVISVTVAVVMALLSVVVLVYFVQHIASIIQSSTIVDRAEEDTLDSVSRLNDLNPDHRSREREMENRFRRAVAAAGEPEVVRAERSGYVQYLDADALVEALAGVCDPGAVEVPFGPGYFIAAGLPLAKIWPASGGKLYPDALGGVRDAFSFGRERSFRQDFAFGLRQLSDIALKGLSPGVNDPTTAMQAMDRMEAVLAALVPKELPPPIWEVEAAGSAYPLKVGHYDFDDVVGLAFDQIRRAAFASGQVAVLEKLLEILDRLAEEHGVPERREALWRRAFAVARLAPDLVSDPQDASNLVLRALRLTSRLTGDGRPETLDGDLEALIAASKGLPNGPVIRERVRDARSGPGRAGRARLPGSL